MLKIGTEKIYTQTEIIDRIRTLYAETLQSPAGLRQIADVLAIALEESREYVEGVLRPRGTPC
jgi:hypothetical protein